MFFTKNYTESLAICHSVVTQWHFSDLGELTIPHPGPYNCAELHCSESSVCTLSKVTTSRSQRLTLCLIGSVSSISMVMTVVDATFVFSCWMGTLEGKSCLLVKDFLQSEAPNEGFHFLAQPLVFRQTNQVSCPNMFFFLLYFQLKKIIYRIWG